MRVQITYWILMTWSCTILSQKCLKEIISMTAHSVMKKMKHKKLLILAICLITWFLLSIDFNMISKRLKKLNYCNKLISKKKLTFQANKSMVLKRILQIQKRIHHQFGKWTLEQWLKILLGSNQFKTKKAKW